MLIESFDSYKPYLLAAIALWDKLDKLYDSVYVDLNIYHYDDDQNPHIEVETEDGILEYKLLENNGKIEAICIDEPHNISDAGNKQ